MNANAVSKQFELHLNECIVLYFMYDVNVDQGKRVGHRM